MSDDFGTVNLRPGDRTREIEVLRQHRESLVKMLAEVDQQLRELELTAPPPPPPASHPTHPALRGYEDPDGPASREIVNTTRDYDDTGVVNPGSGMRVVLILGIALLAFAVIGWLIWRASSNRSATTSTVVEESTAADTTDTMATTVVEGETNPPTTAATALSIRPMSQDYGLVRKGTRTTRQYEIANNSEEPISIALARSACRCLYYEHAPVIPPKAKESITVTIDGAKAKAGTLRETIRVTAKSDPSVETAFDVIATVR